jgi:uncharacterized protein (DUF1800 family)
MAYIFDPQMEHLLRRAGFGARADELDTYRELSIGGAISRLVDYEGVPDDVDSFIGQPGYALTVPSVRGAAFAPNSNIADARQRWLFRMVHTNRPLQEKMTLFWHNHFATAYTKVAGQTSAPEATRYLAAKASEDPGGVRGQIEMLRDNALGNFRDILIDIAKDTAMLYWLDGYLNTRARPQENFGREIMELFTMGVGNYTEPDVYAAARVFSGWNLTARRGDGTAAQQFLYQPNQHETTAKTFSFAIYADGNKTIPARTAADGMQDGIDFINALAANPNTGRYLARKLYRFFVSEVGDVDESFVARIANTYQRSGYDMQAVMRAVLNSPEFWDRGRYYTRYSWPAEHVVRSLKDFGYAGYSLGNALVPIGNMGQNLYDPPDVSGWDLGQSWFSTGSMLARMNFASDLALNQRVNLMNRALPYASSPESLLAYVLDQLRTPALDRLVVGDLTDYLRATGPWTGSNAQVQNKTAGLFHLVAGTPEYQFV